MAGRSATGRRPAPGPTAAHHLLGLVNDVLDFSKIEAGKMALHPEAVSVRARQELADGPAWLVVEVSDTGIGMTPAQMEHLFDEFAQADVTTTRRFGGTGLGLALSQRFCRLMGGTLTARSAEGKGSTFRVRLPEAAMTAAAQTAVA